MLILDKYQLIIKKHIMKISKILLFSLILFSSYTSFSQSTKKIAKEAGKILLEEKKYSVKNESYIKFNYQEHKTESTRYNIRFFEKSNDLEFWGHGRNKLSLLGPIEVTLEGKKVNEFINNIWNTYKKYQKEIRKNQIAYEHMDITLLTNEDVIFSCYMNNRKTKYSFWVEKEKYIIEEKEFLELMAEMKSYFKLGKD